MSVINFKASKNSSFCILGVTTDWAEIWCTFEVEWVSYFLKRTYYRYCYIMKKKGWGSKFRTTAISEFKNCEC